MTRESVRPRADQGFFTAPAARRGLLLSPMATRRRDTCEAMRTDVTKGRARWSGACRRCWRSLHSELLAEDPFVERMAGIEQHVHGDGAFEPRLDRRHEAYLVVVGDGGDRALLGF
jgi:hypothetical protein